MIPNTRAGSAADFLNFQVNGVSKLKVTNTGAIVTAGPLSVTSNGRGISAKTANPLPFSALNLGRFIHTDLLRQPQYFDGHYLALTLRASYVSRPLIASRAH